MGFVACVCTLSKAVKEHSHVWVLATRKLRVKGQKGSEFIQKGGGLYSDENRYLQKGILTKDGAKNQKKGYPCPPWAYFPVNTLFQ